VRRNDTSPSRVKHAQERNMWCRVTANKYVPYITRHQHPAKHTIVSSENTMCYYNKNTVVSFENNTTKRHPCRCFRTLKSKQIICCLSVLQTMKSKITCRRLTEHQPTQHSSSA